MRLSELTGKKTLKLSQIAPAGINKREPFENTLTRAAKAAMGDRTALAEQMGMTIPEMEEMGMKHRTELFPTIGQLAGSRFGPYGEIGGAMAGQGINQLIKFIPGQKFVSPGKPSLEPIAMEGLGTGAVVGVTKGLGSLYFARQNIASTLKKSGKYIGDALGKIGSLGLKNPQEYSIPINDILPHLERDLESVADKSGSAGTVLSHWVDIMRNKLKNGIDHLLPHEAIQFRQRIGAAADFATEKSGFQFQPEVANEQVNDVAKKYYGVATDKVTNLAEKAGFKDFTKHNAIEHELKVKYPGKTLGQSGWDFFERAFLSGAAGAAAHNPLVGAATYEGLKQANIPAFRNAVFNTLQNPLLQAAGKATVLGASREVSDILNS